MGGLAAFTSRWSGFWHKHDPDHVFSYDTFKMVTIRDRYLGFLHHGLQFGQRTQQDPGLAAYCDIPPANTGKPTCIYPPLDQVAEVTGSNLFITTYMERTSYTANCDPSDVDCNPTASATDKFIVGNLLTLNISLDHSAQVNFGGKAPYGELQTLKNPNADEPDWNNYTFYSLSADNIPISSFLLAATLNLEDIGNDYLQGTPDYISPESYRTFGAVILLDIVYDNAQHYFRGSPPILYYYQPRLITDVDDYLEESIYTAYPYNRTILYKKGIHIVGVISGELGHFTFQTLLIQLTTSLALMKVATTVVDLIAINVLPEKLLYRRAKYEKTEDFSDLKDQQKKIKRAASREDDQETEQGTELEISERRLDALRKSGGAADISVTDAD